jgi:diguanylate cyclase (GGDEF)-like protein
MDDIRGSILVIDDEPLNLKLLKPILASKGFETKTAQSSDDAFRLLTSSTPDLILLDVVMPGIGGYEVCRKIKENPKLKMIPVIFLTALTDSDDIVKGFNAGAVDYVRKPFNVAELLARVEAHIELKRDREIIEIQKKRLEQINQELETMNRSLYHRSITDSLTGIFNRQYVLDHFQQEMGLFKRYGATVSMMLLDIDNFKKLNDTYGHIEGDAALIRCSSAIKHSIRTVDILGRYGGEEFFIILPLTELDGAMTVAQRISSAMLNTGNEAMSIPPMTVSVGVAQYQGEDEKEFLRSVDDLLYKAKRLGRNRIESGRLCAYSS